MIVLADCRAPRRLSERRLRHPSPIHDVEGEPGERQRKTSLPLRHSRRARSMATINRLLLVMFRIRSPPYTLPVTKCHLHLRGEERKAATALRFQNRSVSSKMIGHFLK